MALYLITYDNHPPRSYAALYQLMASWQAVKLAESVWLAGLTGTATAVRDAVQNKLQPDDLVAVVELKPGSDWATKGVTADAANWLSNNVQRSA